jgi:hypothetical protein
MIKKLLLTLAAASMMLCASGCSALGTAGTVVQAATSSAPLGDRITMDERGMYAVDLLYNVPASAYRSANERHLITPALRAQVRPILIQMRQLQLAARAAYRVGDATSWNSRVAALQQLRAQVVVLIPSTP